MNAWVPFAKTLTDLGWPEIRAAVSERCSTARGRSWAADLGFLPDRSSVQKQLWCVEEARLLLREDTALPIGGVEELGAALERAAKEAVLLPLEILACAGLIRAAADAKRMLAARRDRAPNLAELASGLVDLGGLASRITAAFEASGEIKDTASAALADLRARVRRLHGELKERAETFLRDPDFAPNLQDNYYSIRNDRYVLPIKASFKSAVPGIVHNASQSGQTLFVEPQQIVDVGNELSIAQSMALEEERAILSEFSSYLGSRAADLARSLDLLAQLDLAGAGARLANDLDAESPELGEASDDLVLRGLRHPLLALRGKRVIANQVLLSGDQRALVVSGPNAGGKTVTITATGLCVLMARAGLPIPAARGSRLPFYGGVCSAIGDAQDLRRDLSTFSAHLTTLRDILATAGPGWLVVIDEIAADTDPKEGAALAAATLEALVSRQVRVLVTTHLDEVKALGLSDARFVNARMGFDAKTLRPTYALQLGAPGVSNALAMAEQVGLPAPLIGRARDLLQSGGALSVAIERLENERAAAVAERRELSEARIALSEAQEQADQRAAEAETARRKAEERVRAELAGELDEARRQVKRLVAELQARPSLKAAQQADHEIARLAAAQAKPIPPAPQRQVPAGEGLRAGAQVRVSSLAQLGEVLAIDGDAAVVAVGSLRTRVPLTDLEPARGAAKRRSAKAVVPSVEEGSSRCDVRGMRADDALREVERFLDQSALAGSSSVTIVHGHGTGALKKLLREELVRLPYVAQLRPGGQHEGGDGVTVVDLK